MISSNDLEQLIQALKDESMDSEDRRGAVRALGRINGAQVVGPLIQALRDNDSSVQSEAEDQLRKIIFDKGLDSNLGDSLIQALKDSDSEVQIRAEESLGRFIAQSALQKEQGKKIQLRYW